MRLIDTHTLALHDFQDVSQLPRYAILSHRWGKEEIALKQFRKDHAAINHLKGYDKIRSACALAKQRGWQWIWIDTCCIDKRSSAELSEAINSMFTWYAESAECIVFLHDLKERSRSNDFESCSRQDATGLNTSDSGTLAACEWFTRGWTLQEMLAPRWLVFCRGDWTVFGHLHKEIRRIFRIHGSDAAMDGKNESIHDRASAKVERSLEIGHSLLNELVLITGVSRDCLEIHYGFRFASVAARMAWASSRTTLRVEDLAYCLLGLFDINMPLLYGEGTKALKRLQEEIISTSSDTSIFAWAVPGSALGILAPSPAEFRDCHDIGIARLPSSGTYYLTNKGLMIEAMSMSLGSRRLNSGWVTGSRFLLDLGWGKIRIEEQPNLSSRFKEVKYLYWHRAGDPMPEQEWEMARQRWRLFRPVRKRTFYIKL